MLKNLGGFYRRIPIKSVGGEKLRVVVLAMNSQDGHMAFLQSRRLSAFDLAHWEVSCGATCGLSMPTARTRWNVLLSAPQHPHFFRVVRKSPPKYAPKNLSPSISFHLTSILQGAPWLLLPGTILRRGASQRQSKHRDRAALIGAEWLS